MKISIITVSLNNAATIEDTINSVASQKHSDVEHIVIDGASTDSTVEIVRRYAGKVAKFVSACDTGIYDAMNKGIAAASGDVIGFLNSDDVYAHCDILSRAAEVFANPDVDACYADLVYVQQEDLGKVVRHWKSKDFRQGLFALGWCPPHPTFFVRKSVYREYGDFDLDYRLAADVELMLRFLEKHHINSVYVPEVWVRMRVGGATNKSLRNIVRQNLEIFRAARKNGVELSPAIFLSRKIIDRMRQYFSRPT